MGSPSSTASVSGATVEVGKVFAEGGFLGIIIYAVMLLFFLLLVRDFLKDWLIRSVSKEQTAANADVAKALEGVKAELRALTVVQSQVVSASGWHEWQRARDAGLLPPSLTSPSSPNGEDA